MAKSFLEVKEKIEAEEATVRESFKGDGQGVRKLREANGGPEYMKKLKEAANLIADVKEGKKPVYLLKEAMTTSDFPLLFGDILDRQLLQGYRETPVVYDNYMRVGTVPDFRQVSRHTIDGGEGVLDKVNEKGEYNQRKLDEGRYQYKVEKYGNKFDFSWETMINDDLGAIDEVPSKFGRAARRTEQKFATELYVDENGPHDSLYRNNHGEDDDKSNIITGNPELSIEGLQAAMTLLMEMTDEDDEPIAIDMIHLVVPPALEVTAQNILNATQLELTGGGGTSDQKLITANWIQNRMQLHVDYYIPIIASGDPARKSWFLFADPANNRPAAEVGFLRGYREPQVFMKSPNAMMVGGQQADPMLGDFESDNIEYKVRHILGGTQMDWRSTVASDGSTT